MADCLEETTSTHLDNDRIIDNLNFQKYEVNRCFCPFDRKLF